MNIIDFKKEAKKAHYDFTIVSPTDDIYNSSRKIANSRFDLKPAAIAYCEKAAHVAFCVKYCNLS